MKGNSLLMPGTLDMLILKAVSLAAQHGYGILLRIQQISVGAIDVPQGLLYPALYRLESRGEIASEWRQSENNWRAKFYSLTSSGRRKLRTETADWNGFAAAVAAALGAEPEKV